MALHSYPTHPPVPPCMSSDPHHACTQASAPATPSGDAAGKLPSGPEPVSADVEYTPAAQLQPLDSPEQECRVRCLML